MEALKLFIDRWDERKKKNSEVFDLVFRKLKKFNDWKVQYLNEHLDIRGLLNKCELFESNMYYGEANNIYKALLRQTGEQLEGMSEKLTHSFTNIVDDIEQMQGFLNDMKGLIDERDVKIKELEEQNNNFKILMAKNNIDWEVKEPEPELEEEPKNKKLTDEEKVEREMKKIMGDKK